MLTRRRAIAALGVTTALAAPGAAAGRLNEMPGAPGGGTPVVTQDLRSPDARGGATLVAPQDLRSPDARAAAQYTLGSHVDRRAGSESGFAGTGWIVAAILLGTAGIGAGVGRRSVRRRRRAGDVAAIG
jgi:hypothetical protein